MSKENPKPLAKMSPKELIIEKKSMLIAKDILLEACNLWQEQYEELMEELQVRINFMENELYDTESNRLVADDLTHPIFCMIH